MNRDKPLLHLPVYEPAGRDVRLDETELLQHLLIIGATGCGKTTLLRRIQSQLIAQPDTGLLIFDAKQDDSVEQIQRLAAQQHREVAVLGTRGTHYLDLFQPLRALTDVDAMVKRLLTGTQNMGRENEFWNEIRETILDAALTLLVVVETPVKYEPAVALMSELFFRPPPRELVDRYVCVVRNWLTQCPPAVARKLQQALDTVDLWKNMDSRTRSSVQATLVNALRPFASLNASRCFEPNGRLPFSMQELVERGGLCVVSVNATTEPDLAGMFFKLVKRDFTNAVQQRREFGGRLCGIIADELPLLVMAEDVETLATVRSRRCFVCAATQGLSILDEKLGERQRKALLANFGSLVFMRGREEATDLMAAVHLGFVDHYVTFPRFRSLGDLLDVEPERKMLQKRLACPPGTLGRLSPHQGFVALPNPERCEQPVWFVPQFEEEPPPPLPPPPVFLPPQLVDPANSERLHRQLQELGHPRRLKAAQWQAALKLFSARKGRKQALVQAKEFFRTRAVLVPTGLESLPLPWLKALPGILWSLRRPEWTHLPYMIREVFIADGLMQFRFAQEPLREPEDQHVGGFDQVRLAVNTRLYPSCYRPLNRRHACRIQWSPPAFPLEP